MITFIILNLIEMQKWCTPVTFRRKHLFMDPWFSVFHFGPPKSGLISKLLFMYILYNIIVSIIIFKNDKCPETYVYLVSHNFSVSHHNTIEKLDNHDEGAAEEYNHIIMFNWLIGRTWGADNLSLLLIWYTMETINLIASTSSDPLEKYQGFKVPGGKKQYNG